MVEGLTLIESVQPEVRTLSRGSPIDARRLASNGGRF